MNRYEKRVLKLREHVLKNQKENDLSDEAKADENESAEESLASENQVEEKETPTVKYPIHTGGGWYELSNGEKVQGKEEAEKLEAGD